jgi:plastocyanin
MGAQSFGVKSFEVVGAGNTSTVGGSADLKLSATGQVAITTNTSVAGVVTATSFVGDGSNVTGISTTNITNYGVGLGGGGGVPANLTATTLDVSGICTAGSFVTDLIDGSGTSRGFATRYYITANGSSDYRFAGPGQRNSVGNPTLYLMRGFTYIFENSTGGSHPFRIQFTGTSTGVGTYVSGSQQGIQVFTIPHDAPASYQYVCTIHGGMLGTFIIPS